MVNKRKYASEQERLTAKADAEKRRRDNAKKDQREEMETLYANLIRVAQDPNTDNRRKEMNSMNYNAMLARINELRDSVDARKEQDKNRKAATRADEDKATTDARREQDKNLKAATRADEDKATTDARREQNKNHMAATRQNEDNDVAEVRREQNKNHMAATRADEDEATRDAKREQDKNRKAATRQNEDNDVAEARRERDRESKSAARNIENHSAAKFYNDKFKDNEIEIHYLGPMDAVCQYCNALHFAGEKPADGKFKTCCHKGKVIKQREEVPEYLKEVMSNPQHPDYKNFNENIRSYNSALSFASMGAKNVDFQGKGPYCFRVHGQIYHCTSNYHPNNNEARQYAQLYVVDSAQANTIRNESTANIKCVAEIMANLDKIIRENNAYAKAYKMLGDIEKEEKQRLGKDSTDVNIVFKRDRNDDKRRYNLPTQEEVAMVFKNSDGEPPFERDFRVYPHPNQPMMNLNILSPNLDPMTYPLLYPFGERGWQPEIELMNNENAQRSKISMLQYKVEQTAVRRGVFNPILNAGKLFQQWAVDSYLQVEANNLNYIKYHQLALKVEQYKGLQDHLSNLAESEGAKVGKTVIQPSTFQGSPRNMAERYQDAMSLVRQYGKPDLFITMTCNPNWQEIQENLFPGQKAADRPDLISRVFSLKLKALMNDILKEGVFGKAVANCYAIEFQKRVDKDSKIDREDYDKIVCAELPDQQLEPELFNIVKSCMIHGPCGKDKIDAPCMENGKCMKEFPKEFIEETKSDVSGYPQYRRRKGPTVVVNGHVMIIGVLFLTTNS